MLLFFLFSILYVFVDSTFVVRYEPETTLYTQVTPIRSHQYSSQDTLGQYSYGYNGVDSSKSELKLSDGITRGSYSYVDANSKLQTVKYIADDINGFQVVATNLPVHEVEELQPTQDTDEVKRAKENHFNALKEAERNSNDEDMLDMLENVNLWNKNENENLSTQVHSKDTFNQQHDVISSTPLVTDKGLANYKSYVKVSTPQNTYAYSVYDHPNSGYIHTYADTFNNYRQYPQ